jgi:sentrin-specific protease 1
LTDVENKLVSGILREGQSGIVAQFNKCTVSYSDIYRLYPETWLNDEIVNYHFELLSQRAISKQDTPEKNTFPTIHCFNTFFCSTLRDQGFAKVKRWTKRVSSWELCLINFMLKKSYHVL